MISKIEISELIPHDGTMVLLDAVNEWDEAGISCSTRSHLRPDNPLLRGGRLAAVCGVEYGAQAMALHGSLVGADVQSGYLAALKDVKMFLGYLDEVTTEITVRAEKLHVAATGAIYAFSLVADEKTIVSGRATLVYRQAPAE